MATLKEKPSPAARNCDASTWFGLKKYKLLSTKQIQQWDSWPAHNLSSISVKVVPKKTIFVCKIDGENASVRGRRESCVENKLAEEHKEILHYFWNKSFPDFGHFRIRKSDRKTVPSSSVIKVWQRERIQDTFDTSGRANLERKSAWELFSWRWSSSKILDHGGRGCRSRLTICQLIQFYTNSEAALLSMPRRSRVTLSSSLWKMARLHQRIIAFAKFQTHRVKKPPKCCQTRIHLPQDTSQRTKNPLQIHFMQTEIR